MNSISYAIWQWVQPPIIAHRLIPGSSAKLRNPSNSRTCTTQQIQRVAPSAWKRWTKILIVGRSENRGPFTTCCNCKGNADQNRFAQSFQDFRRHNDNAVLRCAIKLETWSQYFQRLTQHVETKENSQWQTLSVGDNFRHLQLPEMFEKAKTGDKVCH